MRPADSKHILLTSYEKGRATDSLPARHSVRGKASSDVRLPTVSGLLVDRWLMGKKTKTETDMYPTETPGRLDSGPQENRGPSIANRHDFGFGFQKGSTDSRGAASRRKRQCSYALLFKQTDSRHLVKLNVIQALICNYERSRKILNVPPTSPKKNQKQHSFTVNQRNGTTTVNCQVEQQNHAETGE